MFILVFVLTILILVVIHELGHFLAAKKFNIKVLEFGFGIPPRIFGKKIGETLVSLNWLPFGGFVRLLGEDEVDKAVLDNKRSFAHQAVEKRILVVVAGVVMNLLLAWLLYYVVLAAQDFKAQVPLLSEHKFAASRTTTEEVIIISQVAEGTPAQQAGLKDGERIVGFNEINLKSSKELVDLSKQYGDQKITLKLSNPVGDTTRSVEITPRKNPPAGQGPLGVSLGTFEMATIEYNSFWERLFAGPIHSYNLLTYSFKILGNTFGAAISEKNIAPVSDNVAGPVGITSIVKQILAVKNPLLPYLDFMAALSLNLALVNILPFPGLDGGRFFFLLFEAITRKKVHQTAEKYIHTIGLAILLSLIVLITISDIRKILF